MENARIIYIIFKKSQDIEIKPVSKLKMVWELQRG